MPSAVSLHRYTFKDYLAIEQMSDVRHEYLDGDIYAMAGGTPEHARISARLIARLGALTDRGPCDVYTSDLGIRVRATGMATYADAAVICGPPELDSESPTHCTNPVAIFEVLSPGTESYDRGVKREHYVQIETLRDYVILAQDRPQAEQWTRDELGGWTHRAIDAGGEIVLGSVGGSFPLNELYQRGGR